MNYLPLTEFEQDKLRFRNTSKSIADFLNKFPNNQPYSIAIYGDWGSGKSTMLNFIEKDLNDKNLVLRFNPWEILNEENLVPTLFEEIAFAIGTDKYKKLRKKLFEYGRKICTTGTKLASKHFLQNNGVDEDASDTIADFNSEVVDSLFNSNSPKPLSKRKKELEIEIQKWAEEENKKLVIFIDEVDRLFPSEMTEIFKIIKATISFPGVVFVVAMDKNSVIDSLKSVGITRPDEYLIKLFQQRFYIDWNYQLRTLFEEILIPSIQTFDEDPKNSLLRAINACIFQKKENQFYLKESVQFRDTLRTVYYNIYNELRRHLSIPRNFINYSYYIKSNWEEYYSEIKDDKFEETRDDIIIFLILTLAYIEPKYVTTNIIGSRHIPDEIKNGISSLTKQIRFNLFNSFFNESRTSSNANPGAYHIHYDDQIIRKTVQVIKRYPDHSN
ncbi:KAP family P-loop NTPase fold protein [Salegentibacter sp. T436]|uniref:KAP family P-loop NTPase fold protein n=1 Tax=Salegentibacter sp. T436 TaxID=1729720 RepID=UPI00094A72FB|nr:P-loop NTPase fold protein [Salegentibacter sp. T436]APS40623.1 hypothetical protein AO058_17845 [Salegentibacter sp. T436]